MKGRRALAGAMRAVLAALALLLAGCTAPVPPSAPGVAPPSGEGSDEVQVGSLAAFGNASWSFSPEAPVMLLAPHFFALDEATRALDVTVRAYPPGPALLRVEGFGDAGWVAMPGGGALLRFGAAGANATFQVRMTERFFTVEQLGSENPAGACNGTIASATGERRDLGPGFWSTRAQPGLGTIEVALSGPGPCTGLTLRLAHLGAWKPAAS